MELHHDSTVDRYVASVLGHERIQRGLVISPGRTLPRAFRNWTPTRPMLVPAGTLMFRLDPPAELPRDIRDKALRYGWPKSARLSPLFLSVSGDSAADISRADAQRLTLAILAVLHIDQLRRTAIAPTKTPATGKLQLADGSVSTYSIKPKRGSI